MSGRLPWRSELPPTWRSGLLLGAWGLCATLAVRFVLFAIDAAPRQSHGFVNLYTAARLYREGEDIGQFYGEWFTQQMPRLGFSVGDVYFPNPPTAALLALPLSSFDYPAARVVWTLISLLTLTATLFALVRLTRLRGIWTPIFLAGVLVYEPLRTNVRFAQSYLLLLGLLTLAWWGYRRERPIVLGSALGLMLAFKVSGVWVLLLLFFQRQWKALVWVATTVAGITLVSLPWLGIDAWRVYLSMLPQLRSDPSIAATAFQSQPGFFRHLFTADEFWNPAPLVAAPALSETLLGLSVLLILLPSAWFATRYGRQDLLFAAFVIVGVALVPLALDYHYTLMIMPLAVIWAALQRRPWMLGLVIFAGAVYAIGADLPYRSPRVSSGLWSLLAYPKLYGAWLLWALSILMLYRPGPVKLAAPDR